MMFVHSILIGKRLNNNGLYLKEVCNRGAASSLLKLDGGWQAMPSITKFLTLDYIELRNEIDALLLKSYNYKPMQNKSLCEESQMFLGKLL